MCVCFCVCVCLCVCVRPPVEGELNYVCLLFPQGLPGEFVDAIGLQFHSGSAAAAFAFCHCLSVYVSVCDTMIIVVRVFVFCTHIHALCSVPCVCDTVRVCVFC